MRQVKLGNTVTIDIVDGPVGLIASGGTDSSLLMYILMKEHSEPLHIFTCSSNFKGRANAVVVPTVIEKCIQLTKNINIIHHNFYVDIQDKDNLFGYPAQFLNEGKINILYTGVTANPPNKVADKFHDVNTENDERDPTILRSTWSKDKKIHVPFTNIDKKEVAKIYRELGLLKSLFPRTRSCEKIETLEYYDHCGSCWWCDERLWGFGKL